MAIRTPFTELVGCQTPIQCAGMGIASSDLGVAVAGAGGLGMLSGVLLSPAALEQVLSNLDKSGPGKLGVNFLVPFLEDEAVIDIAANHTRVVEFFYGEPHGGYVQKIHSAGALAAWQVGSLIEAKAAADAGCDFIIAQGVEAGGHVRGTIGLMPLLMEILDDIEIPVVATGAITTARGVAMVLAAGASAARLGSRFVATPESGYHPDYMQALVDAASEDTVYTDRFNVMWDAPHRVLQASVNAVENVNGDIVGQMQLGGQQVDVPKYSVMSPLTSATGHLDAMALYAGQGIGMIDSIKPAARIVREFSEQAEKILTENIDRLSAMIV